jgi:hypothetical protein
MFRFILNLIENSSLLSAFKPLENQGTNINYLWFKLKHLLSSRIYAVCIWL